MVIQATQGAENQIDAFSVQCSNPFKVLVEYTQGGGFFNDAYSGGEVLSRVRFVGVDKFRQQARGRKVDVVRQYE